MSLSTKDVINLVNEIEKSFDVKEWIINDIKVWPIIRLSIGLGLDSISDKKKYMNKKSIVFHLKGLSKIFLHNLFHRHYLKKRKILFITYSSAKHNKIQEKWFDSYLDPIVYVLEKNNISFQFIEYDGNYEYKYPSFHKYRIIQHHLFFNTIKAKFHERKVIIDESSRNLIENICELLKNKGCGQSILTEELVKKRVSQIIVNSKYFTRVLKKCKPSIVIGANYYGYELSMNLSCNKLGIRSVDIQHGVQGENHVAYGSWMNIPESGYELLPQKFATWSNTEKNVIEKWNKSTFHEVKVIGHPMKNYLDLTQGISMNHEKKNSKINVLISLQTGRGLIKLYKELLSHNNQQIFCFIRKHPTMGFNEQKEIKKELSFFNNDTYDYEHASAEILFNLLNRIDVHITENSSVTLEAAQYSIPTIFVHESGKDLFEREISSGRAFYLTEPQQIIEKIISLKTLKTSFANSIDYSQFEERIMAMINS